MLAAAGAGEVQAVFVREWSRLGRDDAELLRCRALLGELGVRLVSATEDDDAFVFGIKAVVAAEERRRIGRHTKAKLREIAVSGRPPCGQPPLSYRKLGTGAESSWVEEERESAVVRRI